jgi:hypothetical protein
MSELDICRYMKRYCISHARRYQKSRPNYCTEWTEEARRWSRLVVAERRFMAKEAM